MVDLKSLLKQALNESNLGDKIKKYDKAIDNLYVSLQPIIAAYNEAAELANLSQGNEDNQRIIFNHYLVQKIKPDDYQTMINILSELKQHLSETTNKDSVTSGNTTKI